ncbi:MAG: sugar ABC transporter ATP-binding protein [Actinobacteria bacterium]|nr:sugar ABC transporter ATP-binding protein [Actinomycetota bacterium]
MEVAPQASAPAAVHVALDRVEKRFGGVHAVRGVSLEVRRGEIHALVGENGAGKSTLAKIVAGVHRPTAGRVVVDGREVNYRSPRHALADGIAMIEQELALLPARSVIDNVFLSTENSRAGLLRRRQIRARFAALVERTGFDLDPDRTVGSMRVAEQQKVEIMRALARTARLIVMDEPTAPLTPVEAESLYTVMRSLRDEGVTIVFVSHFLSEVIALSDTITVMRDGFHVRTAPAAAETPGSLVEGMLGRSLDSTFPPRPERVGEAPRLEVRGLSAAGRFEDVSFTVNAGEIVGLAGLIGSGRTEIARAIFGADRVDSGEILVDGEPVSPRSPRQAIGKGIALLPESRKEQGLLMRRSIVENIMLPHLGDVSSGGVLRFGRERREVGAAMESLSVRAAGPRASVDTLSGGNQQKVLFGKWLLRTPRVMIVDEPTRGVDVGAKRAIYELIDELTAGGTAVLFISSDLEEVLGMAHRIFVMRRGRVAAEFAGRQAERAAVLAAAFGTEGSG